VKMNEVLESFKKDLVEMTEKELTIAASKETKTAVRFVWEGREFLLSPRQATSFVEFCSVFGGTLENTTIPAFLPFPETPEVVDLLGLEEDAWAEKKQELEAAVEALKAKNTPEPEVELDLDGLDDRKKAAVGRILNKYVEVFKEIEGLREQIEPTED